MTIASFSGTFPPQVGKEEGLAWEYGHDYIPVQQWNWMETIVGVTSGIVSVEPSATIGPAAAMTSGVVGLATSTSGDAFHVPWKVRGNVDCTGDFLLSVDFMLNATMAQNVSASGVTMLALSYRAESPNGACYLSGKAFTALQSADTAWGVQTWTDVLAASGLGALVSSECALLSGYVSGLASKGTKFKTYDRVTFKITNKLSAGTTGLPVVLLGLNVFYPRKLT